MQTYDELVERLVHLPRVSAREKGTARCMSGEKSSPGNETLHRLYSPAQDTPPADARALLPPFRPWPVLALVRRLSKTALGLGIVANSRQRNAACLSETTTVRATCGAPTSLSSRSARSLIPWRNATSA
jgi:hypothetical protein